MNLVRDGVIMAVYLFVIIILYIFLSGPFDDFVTEFEDVNMTGSDSHVERGGTYGRLVFDMVFAGFGIAPLFWFIVRAFRREPDWGFRE